jgi:protein gp37
MAETSAIEWTDSTFNPWIGCTKISPACDHCYAEALMDKRHHRVEWGGERSRTSPGNWLQPRRWQKQAAAFRAEHGRRQRVFCSSLADVFDNQVPTEWRDDLWSLIRDTPDLDWQLLTKRPQNIGKMLPAFWGDVKGHVWLGTTVEDQKRADLNIPHLLQHDSAIRFISAEPLLGPLQIPEYMPNPLWNGLDSWKQPEINWVIAGGESGPQARPSHPDWFRSLRDQCAAAGVPFLFKQWGEWAPGECATHSPTKTEQAATFYDEDWTNPGWSFETVTVRQSQEMHRDDEPDVWRLGKKQAGRSLDGVEHNGFPVASC